MTGRPTFSWIPILLHFLGAVLVSWLIQSNRQALAIVQPIVDFFSYVIPSISGYSGMSPNPRWAKVYLVLCWISVPFYFIFFWRLSAFVLPAWVSSQKAGYFWMIAVINLTGSVSSLLLPSERSHIVDASESVRTVAAVASLMKANYLVFAIVCMAVVFAFSFISAATIQAIRLRLRAPKSSAGID
jgi:hypothetical protein